MARTKLSFTAKVTLEICEELLVKYLYINGMYTERKAARKIRV